MDSAKRSGVDSKWSWLMAVGSTLCFFVCMGFTRADGVMFVALMQQMEGETSRETASWPFNLAGAAVVVMAPVTGILSTRFSPLCIATCGSLLFAAGMSACFFSTNIVYLSVCLGLIKGSGQAMMITIIPMLINHSFERFRATAMGIATTGTPLGGFILPLLVQHLLDTYGLKGTFLLLGGIALHALLGSASYIFYPKPARQAIRDEERVESEKGHFSTSAGELGEEAVPKDENTPLLRNAENSKQETSKLKYDEKSPLLGIPSTKDKEVRHASPPKFNLISLKNVFSSRGFYLVAINQILSLQLVEMFSLVVVDYSVDKGIPASKAVILITITSGCEIFGRLSFGWVTDKNYMRRPTYMMFCQCLSAGLVFLFSFSNKFYILGIIAGLLGMLQGSTLSVTHVVFTDYIMREHIALAVAFARSFHGLASVARSPVIGFFRDNLGSYDLLFLTAAAIFLGAGVMWFSECIYLYCLRRNCKEKTQEESV